jgi:hypothetical protein
MRGGVGEKGQERIDDLTSSVLNICGSEGSDVDFVGNYEWSISQQWNLTESENKVLD